MVQLTIFRFSEFILLKKSDYNLDFSPGEIRHLILENNDSKFHSERKLEYRLSRYCISLIYKKFTNCKLDKLESKSDRSIAWPLGYVGSVSHSKEYVLVAMASDTNLLSVGVDIEKLGRLKDKMERIILTDLDLKNHPDLSKDQLFTLIFSAKESLYKALRPLVDVFFGFEFAYVSDVNTTSGEFQINLIHDLPNGFTKQRVSKLIGSFQFFENSIVTSIELPRID